MKLSLQTFTDLVQGMAAAVQSASQRALDLTVGSTLRALLEANASVALWMQWLILQVLQMTRAATSTGADLDSWMADFSLTRLAARCATGMVTFSRFSPSLPALIPPGVLVRTTDAAQTFTVSADTASPLWDPAQGGYSLPAGTVSADLPVVASVAGTSGNVQAGTISLIASALPGVDAVTNPAPFMDGMDAESDPALRARFQAYLASRSRATQAAVGYAVVSVQQGLSYTISENLDALGTARPGSFIVTVDDGSGSPSQGLLSAIYSAIDQVRPLGSMFVLRGPVVVQATPSMAITVMPGADRSSITGQIVNAIMNYINALPVGAALPVTRVAQLAYDANSAVTLVGQVLLNGAGSDLAATPFQAIKCSLVVVN